MVATISESKFIDPSHDELKAGIAALRSENERLREVVETVRKYKLAAHEIHASPITNRTTVECATFIWDDMYAALKKLEEGS